MLESQFNFKVGLAVGLTVCLVRRRNVTEKEEKEGTAYADLVEISLE